MRKVALAALAVVAVVSFAAGVSLQMQRRSAEMTAATALSGMAFPTLDGSPASLGQWRGKVLVVNFWASWCAPCREEIPGLANIQRKYAAKGVQVVGIAVDTADISKAAAAALGIAYPVLVGGFGSVDLTRRLGNTAGALPYTVIFDREGAFVGAHLGLLRESQLEAMLEPLLA